MTHAESESFWKGTRVLVTGAGGFIGSHLTERLVELGATTRALVHYRSDGGWGWLDHMPVKDAVEVIPGELSDRDSVHQAMQDQKVVFHLGALIAIPYSYQAPASFVQTNVVGTLNVLQAARDVGVRRVVHTSTSEVYGTARTVPIAETHPLQGQSPYAATKIGADKLAEAFHRSYGLPLVTVRPFNTFGPRQSGRAVIPTIITQCLTDGVVRLGNTNPTRDMNYISDIIEGFLQAAMVDAAVGRAINLGSGRETSVQALVEMIAQRIGTSVELEQETVRVRPEESEVERLVADATLAHTLLGWQPSVALEEGLDLTVAWVREHLDEYRAGAYAI